MGFVYGFAHVKGFVDGGIAAYLSTKVENIKTVAYSDLGAEAVFEIEVSDLPLFVAYDIYGGDIFESALRIE